MKTFRDLLIWQNSIELVTKIYQETKQFPEDEKYGLVTQLRRSAVSIPSNIAEGYGRNSKREFSRYLHIAMGSLFEVQTQIEIAQNLKYLKEETFLALFESSREIERMMSSFINTLK